MRQSIGCCSVMPKRNAKRLYIHVDYIPWTVSSSLNSFSCYRLLIFGRIPSLSPYGISFRSHYFPLFHTPSHGLSLCIQSCFVLHFPFPTGEVNDLIRATCNTLTYEDNSGSRQAPVFIVPRTFGGSTFHIGNKYMNTRLSCIFDCYSNFPDGVKRSKPMSLS